MSVGGRAAPVAADYPVCRDLFADDDRRLRRAWQLAYDPESNLASRTENGAATAYAYDNLYHLTGADAPGSAQDELWTYDLLGNRLTDLRQGGTQAWQYNADNQLLQSYNHLGQPVTYVYDAAGNLLRKQNPLAPAHSLESRQFVYDVSGRLSQVLDGNGALVADYRYDPFGRRISKSVYRDLQGEELAQPQSRWFVYAAEGLVAETTGAAQYENFYGWQPDGLWGTSPVFVRRLAENGWGENYWYLVDHLGTPRQLVDSAGASVWVSSADTFGEPGFSEANAFDNRLGFAGQYFDAETGSFYNYFRNYDPVVGRYFEGDLIGLQDGPNRYLFVGGNPTSYSDRFGLSRGQGNTAACSYYEDMIKSNPQSRYYPEAAKICRGENEMVNIVFGLGIAHARLLGRTDKSNAEILTKIRNQLVFYDKQVRQQGLIDSCGDPLGDSIDSYHEIAFADAGINPRYFYGGNLWAQGTDWNPVPYDPRGDDPIDDFFNN